MNLTPQLAGKEDGNPIGEPYFLTTKQLSHAFLSRGKLDEGAKL